MKKKWMVTLMASLCLLGCIPEQPKPDDPKFAPVEPEKNAARAKKNGSIFQIGSDRSLYEDVRAKRVGDIVTVRLDETTTARKQAETKTKKNDTLDLPNPTILGTTPLFNLPSNMSLPLASTTNNTAAVNMSANRNFEGKGESSQSNGLTGSITVTVVEVQSNGNMIVRGEKWLNLNQGSEYIRLSGIIRPDDVDTATNTVSSQKVANARISYGGTGDVSDSNVKGWLSRFFSGIFWIV